MSLANTLAACKNDRIWSFFGAEEVLKLSVCSRASAGIFISAPAIKVVLKDKPELNFIGKFELSFGSEITIGMLRRICNRLLTGVSAVVTLDDFTGRVMLDIGSAFNDNNAFLSSNVQPVVDEEAYNEEVFKHLNLVSFDEYDDFNPRHPKPRDQGSHRRGDSYFSSDIEMLANEPKLKFDIQTLNVAAIGQEAEEAPVSNLKSKFLSKTKNIIPGRGMAGGPPTHRGAARRTAQQQLMDDDDEDN